MSTLFIQSTSTLSIATPPGCVVIFIFIFTFKITHQFIWVLCIIFHIYDTYSFFIKWIYTPPFMCFRNNKLFAFSIISRRCVAKADQPSSLKIGIIRIHYTLIVVDRYLRRMGYKTIPDEAKIVLSPMSRRYQPTHNQGVVDSLSHSSIKNIFHVKTPWLAVIPPFSSK